MLKYLIGIFLLIIVVGGVYYFFDLSSFNNKIEKPDELIKMAFVGPLSGDYSFYSLPIKNSVELAIKDLRTQGELIDIVYEDTKCDVESAKAVTSKLINTDKIKIIIGGVCNGETLAMSEMVEKNQVVLFSPAATSPDITNAGTFTFRNTLSDSYGGYVLANMLGQKYKSVAIVSENTDHAEALRQSFLEKVTDLDVEVLVDELFLPDTKDFRPIFAKIKNTKTEAIIINPQTEQSGGLLVKGIRDAKIKLPIFAHIIPGGLKFLEVATKSSDGIVFTDLPNLNHESVRVKAFLEDYKKTFGNISGPEFYMAAAYDAVNILIQATDNVGYNSVKVRDYLYNLPEYDGLLGKYSFDLNGDVVGLDLVLKQIKNGRVEDYSTSTPRNSTTTTDKSI